MTARTSWRIGIAVWPSARRAAASAPLPGPPAGVERGDASPSARGRGRTGRRPSRTGGEPVTAMAAFAAIAASTALPPRVNIAIAACVASWSAVAATASRARTLAKGTLTVIGADPKGRAAVDSSPPSPPVQCRDDGARGARAAGPGGRRDGGRRGRHGRRIAAGVAAHGWPAPPQLRAVRPRRAARFRARRHRGVRRCAGGRSCRCSPSSPSSPRGGGGRGPVARSASSPRSTAAVSPRGRHGVVAGGRHRAWPGGHRRRCGDPPRRFGGVHRGRRSRRSARQVIH